MNPLIHSMSGNNNIISNILASIMKNNLNPRSICMNMLSQNSDAQQMLSNMQNACGSRNPRDFVIETCKNNGISEEQVLTLANKLGIK